MKKGVSIIITTNGGKPDKTVNLINSINSAFLKVPELDYQIIVSGMFNSLPKYNSVLYVDKTLAANNGMLGEMRNAGAENAKYDVLVFCDDDLYFDSNWGLNFKKYYENNEFDILGTQVRLFDGSRYWDRATINPHQMIDYDCKLYRGMLYQSGAYWIIKKSVWEKEKWDPTIPFYATDKGFPMNEDVEYSLRLQKAGYKISFDKNNIVYHDDDTYIQIDNLCIKKNLLK